MTAGSWRQAGEGLWKFVWGAELQELPPARRFFAHLMRAVHMVIREWPDGQISMRAMSLVYTTLLSIVPLLAVSFSVLKGFGVHNQIEPLLGNFLAPMGEQGVEITERIIGFVENIKAGLLGGLGLALLFYTVVSLIQKIERAFNYTWRIAQPRSLMERFSGYLSVIIIGPVLIFTAVGITATFSSAAAFQEAVAIEPVGTTIRFASKAIPYLLVIGAFTFVYIFIPNTKVRIGAAFIGAVVAAILWQSVGWAFASFVVTSARHTAIYSSFAVLFLFMVWLYLSWMILLVGATVAFYMQHSEYLGLMSRDLRLSGRVKERVAMLVMYLTARRYHNGEPPWTVPALSHRLRFPELPVAHLILALEQAGLLIRAEGGLPSYVPGRDLSTIRLRDVFEAIRCAAEDENLGPDKLPSEPPVDEITRELDEAAERTLRERTLSDLVACGVSHDNAAPVPIRGNSEDGASKPA
jgi:membrane protein